MNKSKSALLTVSELSVGYLDEKECSTAVDNVSFDIHSGELFALVGESGCGKSTLIGALLRTLRPPGVIIGGRAIFGEVDLLTAEEERLSQLRWSELSLVPQSAMNALNPVLSVYQQFRDVLRANESSMSASTMGEQRLITTVTEALELVELSADVLNLYPHQLSGGMRQRVAIALALILKPDLIIMDEPTTALDVIVQADIMNMVIRLKDLFGFSILLITHDLPLVLSLADRVGVMRDGQLLTIATPVQLLTQDLPPYIAQLIEVSKAPMRSNDSEPSISPEEEGRLLTLSARGLVKEYRQGGLWRKKRKRILNGVNLDLYRGETLALVGASGSGKSTLARLLTLMEAPTSGTLSLGQVPLNAHRVSLSFRAKVQMVFQDPFGALNPVHNIAYHLQRPLKLHHQLSDLELRRRALELLESVGLSPAGDFIDRHPHALSGGQRQRVCIARALASEPEVLIADEPTSMLDVSLREELLTLLRGLIKDRNLSLLLITHDLITAQALADRVMILKEGMVIETGSVSQVFSAPQHPYTQQLIEATPRPPDPVHLSTSSSANTSII